MDVLPSLSTIQESAKEKHMKPHRIDDIDSMHSTTITDTMSVSVNFITHRASKAKLPVKKPVEAPKKLKKRVQQITDENATLAKIVADKNKEIEILKQSVHSLNEVLESVPIDELRSNSSIASNKIIELNKKNRQLRVELESKKSLLSKRDIQIHKLENEVKELKNKLEKEDGEANKGTTAMLELQTKFNALQQKLFETRNKNVELQEKLKLAGKCLQQEIGDSFDLNKLNAMAAQNTCNWRGRAQQIIHLQQTIDELKSRIQMGDGSGVRSCDSGYDCQTSDLLSLDYSINSNSKDMKQPRSTRSMKSAMSFDRLAPTVRSTEIKHRAKVSELEKVIADLNTQVDEHKNKILALKVRNKNLNEELFKYKEKIQSIEECTGSKGLNMIAINEQLQLQKYDSENRLEKLSAELKDLKQRLKASETREEEFHTKLVNTEDLLNKRTEYIVELEAAIKKLEQDLKSVCGDFLFSCRELRKEEFVAILDSLELEKNNLIEQNNELDSRLKEERTKNEGLSEQVGKQKIRIARLEGRIRDLEKELETSGKKKERLHRITDYSNNLSAKSSVSSIVFENSHRSSLSSPCTDENCPKINDLKQRLEFANEKIKLLEDRLAYLTNEKERDRKAFQETIANTKQTILDTIHTYGGNRERSSVNLNSPAKPQKSAETNSSSAGES